MALQSTGTISLNDLQTAYGGVNPIGLNEYYRGGGLVANGTGLSTTIPTSGAISFSNFYGQKYPITGAYSLTTNANGTTGFISGKGFTQYIYYRGFKSAGELYYPAGGTNPANNTFGTVAGNGYTTPGGSFNVTSMYSAVSEYNGGGYYIDCYLVAEVRRTGSYLPNDDGLFTKFSFPIYGSAPNGIPTTLTLSRNAATLSQYVSSTYYYNRYVWQVYSGGNATIAGAYYINGGSSYSVTYYA